MGEVASVSFDADCSSTPAEISREPLNMKRQTRNKGKRMEENGIPHYSFGSEHFNETWNLTSRLLFQGLRRTAARWNSVSNNGKEKKNKTFEGRRNVRKTAILVSLGVFSFPNIGLFCALRQLACAPSKTIGAFDVLSDEISAEQDDRLFVLYMVVCPFRTVF